MQLSFSAVSEFESCPRKFYQVKILKAYPHEDTDATIYGKEVHLACEEYIRDGKPLGGHARFQPILDKLNAFPGDKHCELEMAIDKNGQYVDFNSDLRMYRGIADLVIVDGDTARVIDYKTGKANYPKPKQLELMALMVFAKFPAVMKVSGALLFLLHDVIVKRDYDRKDFISILNYWSGKRDTILLCAESDTWNPNPSGLCPYCPHKSCEYWKPKRR
jgi:CRISPR/Cas system-associated exonuclease Cas4 (RecB family)